MPTVILLSEENVEMQEVFKNAEIHVCSVFAHIFGKPHNIDAHTAIAFLSEICINFALKRPACKIVYELKDVE